jgi:arabinofuranosyltransferase
VIGAPVAAAVVHAAYVVRVGGDFMHGRFLLPTRFGRLVPVMLVRVPLDVRPLVRFVPLGIAFIVVVAWSIAAAVSFRIPYENAVSDDGLADERGVYVLLSGHHNPIEIDDYMQMSLGWTQEGQAWHDRARDHPRVLIVDGAEFPLVPSFEPGIDLVAFTWNIGLSGYAAGTDVHVTDRYGLADPLASRLLLTERGRPGHEKQLDPVWAIARFGSLEADTGQPTAVDAARTALTCGDLPDLLDAVGEPLTTGRFFDNLSRSLSLHGLRVPNDPQAAVDEHC